jgi:hypothetical protein
MKKLILLLALLPFAAQSQRKAEGVPMYDTVRVSDQLNHMQYCLRQSDMHFKRGLMLFALGTAFNLAGAVIEEPVLYFGGVMCYVGSGVVLYNSRRWIGRAGVSVNGPAVNVIYTFK